MPTCYILTRWPRSNPPIYSQFPNLELTLHAAMSKWANECEHIFYLQGPLGYPGAVIVSDAAVLRPLMSRDTPKSVLYRLFYPWLGIGLLTA